MGKKQSKLCQCAYHLVLPASSCPHQRHMLNPMALAPGLGLSQSEHCPLHLVTS